jgi:hypothetical protein
LLITLQQDNNGTAVLQQETKLMVGGAERGKRESEGEKERNDKVSWERRNTEVKDNA